MSASTPDTAMLDRVERMEADVRGWRASWKEFEKDRAAIHPVDYLRAVAAALRRLHALDPTVVALQREIEDHLAGRAAPGPAPELPTVPAKANTVQDLAEVRGWGYVAGLTAEQAQRLIDLIPTLGNDTLKWGSAEDRAPCVEADGRVRVAMAYGPVLGAWPADLKKKLQHAADQVQPGASVEVVSTARDVKASRDEYEALAEEVGRDEAVKRLATR